MHRKLIAALTGLALVGAGTGAALSSAAAPNAATVKESAGTKFKANRYIQDELRYNRDVYTVRSGGTLTFVDTVASEGPHTLTVVRAKDEPKSVNCKICEKLGKAHGANPQSQAPPKYLYLENGKGSATVPKLDRPGDSAFVGRKGDKVRFKVTAKAGTTLSFVCLIHPWMQAKIKVVK